MQTIKKKSAFLGSEEAIEVKQKLQHMVSSGLYNTASSYTSNCFQYPDNLMPFVDKHMNYLNSNPKLIIDIYLTNLRLMTRIK